jgi:ribonuclease D
LEEITLKELESKSLPHPYEYEIRNYQASESVLSKDDTQVSLSMDEVPLYFIETVEQLEEILPKLLNAKELAIDLEHHDYLTYQGFTCLMQISTRTEDFIIDTLKLRKELFVLNQVFANPQIVKVLHGSDFDVIWLQRDFGLYIVGLFDTYQACKLLNTDQKSLAYLLKNKTEAQFEADKKYQLADWRIRPLTKEMINYARADTHYLLEIYDNMKTELLENTQPNHPSQIYTVLDWSAEVALKKHEKSIIDFEFGLGPNGWSKILKKFNVPLAPRQVEAFKYLHRWRDMIARQQDDSVRYVLPDHLLIKFATNMPTSTSDVFKLCDVVPNIVRSDATEIVNIINESKQALLAETEQLADTAKGAVSSVTAAVENISIDSEKPLRPLSDVLPPNLVVTDLAKQHSQLFGTSYKFTDNFHATTRNAQIDQILSNLRFSPLPDNIKIIFDDVANPDDEIIYKKPKREAEDTPINLDPKVYQLSASIETTKPNEELISEPQIHRGSENVVNPEDAIPSGGYDYEAELDKMTKELAAPSAKKSKFLKNTKNSFNPQNEIVDNIPQPKKKANHNEKGNRSIYVKKGKK